MGDVVPYLVVFGCLVAVMGFFTWLKGVVRRRGLAGSAVQSALAACEEAIRITSHDSHHEVRAAADRRAPVAAPGDPFRPGGFAGGPRSPVAAPPGRRRGMPRRRFGFRFRR
ncbi:hypothetical protein OG946_35375 [Streptomyces sp. NBC_01808]|uniref:hypothetical protein n=1 Tax=Streptomyces sp. NBC_01808 TaxID=2975947 RepID=UPI002DDC2D37|nr:hypothetical protein [Streptomyces sp. NBC_01808]WSA42193.1 hypothetical protein OG946_35375 [Streptomyces sp. NBC_01808]